MSPKETQETQEIREIRELRRQLEEEQQRRREEQQRRREAEDQLRRTTLPEFLDACHVHLSLGLTVQQDKQSSTKGDPANADQKLRPTWIREWADFPTEQMAIWEDLMDFDFLNERHFTPLGALKEYGKEVRERMVSSELDLGYFLRQTLESRVTSVIKQLHANPRLRQTFCLKGDISFENHANSLTDETNLVSDLSSLSLTQSHPRRSRRLAAKSQPPGQDRNAAPQKISRPRADQFCVYNKGPDGKVPAFIIEYKAPHKLSLAHIKAGLQDMNLDDVLRLKEDESPEDTCRRVIGAVITQAFSYMIQAGLEYGYVCTGEAFIFLRVRDDDPSTVYYFLSIPEEDVGQTTGWTGNLDSDNRLHLTALGQVAAFTVRALRTPTRHAAWIAWATRKLKTWEMIYDELLDEIQEKDIPSSVFKPPTRSRMEYCRTSPVKTRSKAAGATVCNPPEDTRSLEDDDDDDVEDGFDPNTPSRRPPRLPRRPLDPSSATTETQSQTSQSKGKSRQYCTQQCLQGLVKGGKLDWQCPNVLAHGVDRHRLTPATLIHRLDRQFSMNIRPDGDMGCESLHIHGSRGALFKITLWSHGYTFVGKGSPVEFVAGLKHEELIYSHLAPVQGVYVPVLLGSLRLRHPFSYDGIAEMVQLMFMSYAGKSIARSHRVERDHLIQQAEKYLQAIHDLHVLQGDPIPGNMVEDNGRLMFIDFERATLQNRRTPLGGVSLNPKREASTWEKSHRRLSCFEREKRRMRSEM
ncbi:hypothetical protein BO94DRAFT_535225 [Aspergillus sclerotioniger CBS 115572]|uniref:Protein kinase domain-containing protein n=1 Tax=Aspergillus sclerotioniger CBS 115572 TaxID=1450535 RepID=A0A317WLB2_9EURO|nr:hypothetical protein BO94DRAFT_535225 [Aspergillus sclerotioniger CBS 115572]PWY87119.1 hypothetical protein BO94DRAFT_535225 [Aspergillus sclerotioniger CBS 115572]